MRLDSEGRGGEFGGERESEVEVSESCGLKGRACREGAAI